MCDEKDNLKGSLEPIILVRFDMFLLNIFFKTQIVNQSFFNNISTTASSFCSDSCMGSLPYPSDNAKRQIDVIGGWDCFEKEFFYFML